MPAIREHTPVQDVIAGTATEIGQRLRHARADKYVLVPLHDISAQEAKDITYVLAEVIALKREKHLKLKLSQISGFVDALVPDAPNSQQHLLEAKMLARAKSAVLTEGAWLTTKEIADLAGFSNTNPSAQPNKWKRAGLTFAISHHGTDYFPEYGLDADNGYRPRKPMAEIIKIFGDSKDGWGLAFWFSSVNSFLGGKRPQDLLKKRPERVIAAAEDEHQDIAHG
jgi:hypothetical protein